MHRRQRGEVQVFIEPGGIGIDHRVEAGARFADFKAFEGGAGDAQFGVEPSQFKGQGPGGLLTRWHLQKPF